MLDFQQEPSLRDRLTGALIGLARATEGNEDLVTDSTNAVILEGLSATAPDTDCDSDTLLRILTRADGEKRKLVPMCYECLSSCGRNNNYDMSRLQNAGGEIRSLKARILSGIREIAVAAGPDCTDDTVHRFLCRALVAIGLEDCGPEVFAPIAAEIGEVKRHCLTVPDEV